MARAGFRLRDSCGVSAPSSMIAEGRDFRSLRSDSLLNRLTGSAMPFGWTVNPFRGCEVGCRYCYARPTHEYLGHTDPMDFEERIYVKTADMSRLLRDLKRARDGGPRGGDRDGNRSVSAGGVAGSGSPGACWRPWCACPACGSASPPSPPVVTRDIDLLRELASGSDLRVNVSLISLDDALLRLIEPRAPRPDLRLRAMRAVADAGIRTRIFVMPVLPVDHGRRGGAPSASGRRPCGRGRGGDCPGPLSPHTHAPGISSSTS